MVVGGHDDDDGDDYDDGFKDRRRKSGFFASVTRLGFLRDCRGSRVVRKEKTQCRYDDCNLPSPDRCHFPIGDLILIDQPQQPNF